MYKSQIMYDDFHADTKRFFKNKKILVTGGTGFIGSHLVEQLLVLDARPIVVTRQDKPVFLSAVLPHVEIRRANLSSYEETFSSFRGVDAVIHLAATVAGLEYNKNHPATIYYQNSQIFLNAIEAAKNMGIEYFSSCSSACVYPRHCTIPTPECDGVKDEPEPTNSGYGWSKRMQEYLSMQYAEEFGMKIAIPRPYNGYGPRDNFDLNTSHVIPALIKKAFDTEMEYFEVWGDGNHSRSFLFVDDFARGILEVTARYHCHDPINIGTDKEVTIKKLADMISRKISVIRGREITPVFNTAGLTGQPRRKCDNTQISQKLGYKTFISLCEGLSRTIRWYREMDR